jgi:hypothetical protein
MHNAMLIQIDTPGMTMMTMVSSKLFHAGSMASAIRSELWMR